jgi:ubiquinone/menaquinone biosynthesis C-methylase UbiE
MDQLERVRDEFRRQADTFDAYAPGADVHVEERFRSALGEHGVGTAVLDLACGPGVVTAALAGQAASVVAFDATDAMLAKARARCAEAGHDNVVFRQGDASAMPFEAGAFDAVVTRLAIHHFEAPAQVLAEIHRVLRPAGKLVIADVVVSAEPDEAVLQNAIEILRDPSHVRMLPAGELLECVEESGFAISDTSTWRKHREFDEWMGIANDPRRTASLRVIARALAEAGRTAGMGLTVADGKLVFFHDWLLVTASRDDSVSV